MEVETGRVRGSLGPPVQLSQFGCSFPLGVFDVCLLTLRPSALTSMHVFRFAMLDREQRK